MTDSENFQQSFREFIGAVADVRGVLPEIAEIIRSSVDRNFQSGGRYGSDDFGGGSQRWGASKASTQRRGQPLLRTGQLAASITYRITNNGIEIGSNKAYAAIHQFGGLAGRGLRTRIPARPYVVLQREDELEIEDAIFEHYSRVLR